MAKVDVKPAHAGTKRRTLLLIQSRLGRWRNALVARVPPAFDGKGLVGGLGAGTRTADGTHLTRPRRAENEPPGDGIGEPTAVQRRDAYPGMHVIVASVAFLRERLHKRREIRCDSPRLLPWHTVHTTVRTG